MADEIDALNVRMRNVENKIDDYETKSKSRPRSKRNETSTSTPRNLSGNLPHYIPPGLSKSVPSPAENSILVFKPVQKDKTENIRRQLNEHLLEEDDLEDISKDDQSEETCIVEVEDSHAQSFLGMGQGNRLQF